VKKRNFQFSRSALEKWSYQATFRRLPNPRMRRRPYFSSKRTFRSQLPGVGGIPIRKHTVLSVSTWEHIPTTPHCLGRLCRSGASLEQLVSNIHEWHVYFLMRRPFARLNLFLPPSSYSPLLAQCCLQFRPSTVCDALLGPNAGHQHANENQDSEPWSPLFPREGWPSSSSSNPSAGREQALPQQ